MAFRLCPTRGRKEVNSTIGRRIIQVGGLPEMGLLTGRLQHSPLAVRPKILYLTTVREYANTVMLVPLEAVSPIMTTRDDWAQKIDRFWQAQGAVFHMPERSSKCGGHIHITPSNRVWSNEQLQLIAIGVIFYEKQVLEMLPTSRRYKYYCMPNTKESTFIRDHGIDATIRNIRTSPRERIETLIQDERRVLWNLKNVTRDSGTIEFRGGRCLRGPCRTKRWIAFVIGFIELLLHFVSLLDLEC